MSKPVCEAIIATETNELLGRGLPARGESHGALHVGSRGGEECNQIFRMAAGSEVTAPDGEGSPRDTMQRESHVDTIVGVQILSSQEERDSSVVIEG